MTPLHDDQSKTGPRLDRLDAKASYCTDSIEHLEHRIAELERRIGGAGS